jgi:hypothetical protein
MTGFARFERRPFPVAAGRKWTIARMLKHRTDREHQVMSRDRNFVLSSRVLGRVSSDIEE